MAETHTFQPDVTTEPAPLQIAKDGTLHITIRPQGAAADCGPVSITVPVGPGTAALTADPQDIRVSNISSGWHTGDTVKGATAWTFTVKPTRGMAQITADLPLRFSLQNINVSKEIGSSTVTVTAHTDPPVPFTLARMPQDFTFQGFVPETQLIDCGHKTILHWEINQSAQVTLNVVGVDEKGAPHAYRQSVTDKFFDTGALYGNTFFQLTATVTQGIHVAEHTLDTWVIVAKPSVETGRLAVSGTAHVLGTPQIIAAGPAFFTAGTKTLTTTTDGMVCTRLKLAGKTAGAVQFTVSDGPGINGRAITVQSFPINGPAGPQMSDTYTEFLLRADTSFTIGRPSGDTTPIETVDVRWIPLGQAKLT
ncbi:hypothetical protein [Streptomyces griseus]|uniref:hypothetical protein n=1 Tax=Streptomyces griseus TaxID=1911 RepID=UPI003689EDAA